MTAAAIETEFSVMHIVASMAIAAAIADSCHCRQGLPVTFLARDFQVGTGQREVRLRVMVENPLQPFDRVVTVGATICESALMRVVFDMTVDAEFGCVAKNVSLVTVFALHR